MEHVHIDNQDYANEFKEYLYSGVKYTTVDQSVQTSEYNFTFSPEFSDCFTLVSQFVNPLIYGKNTFLGITAVEVVDQQLELFFSNGSVKRFDYKPWVLVDRKLDEKCKRLDGFLTYKFIRYFEDQKEAQTFYWRYSKSAKMFQCYNPREAALLLNGITLFKGLQPRDLAVVGWDIESAGLEHNKESTVFIITNTFQKGDTRFRKHFREDEYPNVGVMIEAWCEWIREVNPDVMVGHNIYGYDFPYLEFVGEKFGVKLNLGRDVSEIQFNKKTSEYRVDGNTSWTYKKAHIYGRHIIDGMFLAVKYDVGRKYPSWGLKPIAEFEGLVKEDRQFYDASKIKDNWHDPIEREKIVQYAMDDSDDSLNLYNKMIPAYFYMCQSLPIPFEEMMQGATGKWMNSIVVRSYLQKGHSIPEADNKTYVHGGISFGNPGLYKNVMKVDVTSLYPSCILTYKIGPHKKDPDNAFLNMVQFFTDERIANKKRYKETKNGYFDDLQGAQKIAINSSYGMLGTNGLQFNDFSAANSVTLRGRAVLRKAIIWASGKDVGEWFKDYDYTKDEEINEISVPHNYNFIIGPTDTDSISFCKPDFSVFSTGDQVQLLSDLNSIMDKGIVFEDDGYYSHILAVAAKNYVLIENGKTEMKFKGSSIKDAKKEPILREFMNEVIESLLYERGTVPQIYGKYCDFARDIQDISKWAVKKSISKKLLASDRKQEKDVVNALGDMSQYREGDKVFLYNSVPRFIPEFSEDGEPVLYKSGANKGKQKGKWDKVLKLTKDWNNDSDTEHYLGRVYNTLDIFSEVLDMSQFVCYSV